MHTQDHYRTALKTILQAEMRTQSITYTELIAATGLDLRIIGNATSYGLVETADLVDICKVLNLTAGDIINQASGGASASATTPKPELSGDHWTDPRSELPDADTLVRVICQQTGYDYIEMFCASYGSEGWVDTAGNIYKPAEILTWRDLTEAELDTINDSATTLEGHPIPLGKTLGYQLEGDGTGTPLPEFSNEERVSDPWIENELGNAPDYPCMIRIAHVNDWCVPAFWAEEGYDREGNPDPANPLNCWITEHGDTYENAEVSHHRPLTKNESKKLHPHRPKFILETGTATIRYEPKKLEGDAPSSPQTEQQAPEVYPS